MKRELSAKGVILFFCLLAALYLGMFYGWEHWQRHSGPWRVEFLSDEQGRPSVSISQPALGIAGVQLVFRDDRIGDRRFRASLTFDRLKQQAPFGKVIYEDLRSMPGIVTFDLFGHEIELRPRVLVVNRTAVPWKPGQVIEFSAADKPLRPPEGSKR